MKKVIIILAFLSLGILVKAQSIDSTIAFTIEKEVVDLRTGATYSDSLYVIAKPMTVGFPFLGEKRSTQLLYSIYASKNIAWDGFEPIYNNLDLNYNTGYFLNGISVALILTKIRNDMLTRFSGFSAGDVVPDFR